MTPAEQIAAIQKSIDLATAQIAENQAIVDSLTAAITLLKTGYQNDQAAVAQSQIDALQAVITANPPITPPVTTPAA